MGTVAGEGEAEADPVDVPGEPRSPMLMTRLLLVAAALAALITQGAAAKSYVFPLVQIDARANPDGSIWITERRTYDFSGSFSWGTYALERRGWSEIVDVSVADEGGAYVRRRSEAPRTYQVSMTPHQMEVKWYYSARDQQRTFTIRYRVLGVITRYLDTAELYWRFVGTGWDAFTKRVRVTVQIPGASRQDLRAWGHGPLTGVVTLDDGVVRLSIDDLDAATFVEGRILFPAALVPGARFVDQDALPRILAEEGTRAREANLERLGYYLNFLTYPLVVLGALALWFVLYLRFGKEHRIRLEDAYLREPPASYGPAILGGLLRWGKPGAQDFAATILDLARRGYIKIEDEGHGRMQHRFERTDKPEDGLPDSDRRALGLMFKGARKGNAITDAEFRASADNRDTIASRMFSGWQNAVEKEVRAHGFFDEHSTQLQRRMGMIYWLFMLGGIALTAIVFFGLRIPLGAGFLAFPIGARILLGLRGPLSRRSREGATHLAKWRAFRRFLCDFSNLKDAPAPAIAVWEVYLTYAVTLGVADRVVRQFPVAYPDGTASHALSWYTPSRHRDGANHAWQSFSNLSSISRTLSKSVAIASSPRTSSSGSGGGFSRGSSGSSGSGSRGGGGTGGRAG
ncbi:MAG: DUF2207 domain-containing protein [bacterium]